MHRAEATALLGHACRVTFVAAGAQSTSACMKYDLVDHQFTYPWKLGQPIGDTTITVDVAYAGWAMTTTRSEAIVVTK